MTFEKTFKTVTSLSEDFKENEKYFSESLCDRLDKELDQLVYELYGLTEEEIQIVDESASTKK